MSHYFFTFNYFDIFHSRLFWPALATLSLLLLVIQKLYLTIRPKFPIKVNCWFCNSITTTPYNSSNSWYCPECDQYNGFTPDGGYNRLLPEQHRENLNNLSFSRKTNKKISTSNGLCRFCNINLELKVQQLAQFVPFNQNNYDEEIQQYSEQLERVYRLCNRCQDVLKKTLHKQETFISSQNHQYLSNFHHSSQNQAIDNRRNRNRAFTILTGLLSSGLLLSVLPFNEIHSLLPLHLTQIFSSFVEEYIPISSVAGLVSLPTQFVPQLSAEVITTTLLGLGVITHFCELAYTRKSSVFINLLLWILLLSLTRVNVKVDGLVTVAQVLGSVMFIVTSILEVRSVKHKNIATVKPVQLQKLDKVQESKQGPKSVKEESPIKPTSLQSPVPDSPPTKPSLVPLSFTTPEDFGFGSLSVSPKRVTRSQTQHFQAKSFGVIAENEPFSKPKFNLSPPRLTTDNISSTSSGFVSMTHHKDYYRTPSPSVVDDNIESVSQCGEHRVTQFSSHMFPPTPYNMQMSNFSNFPPYTLMHFSPPFYNKLQYSNMITYEPSLNLSNESVHTKPTIGVLETVKNVLSSMMFFFLITTNIAVLWTVFGKEYLKS